jgi:hypothetical protein
MVVLAGALCAGVLALLSGCAGLMGSHDVDISESQLTLLLARQFPMERKVLEVIDLNITNPQIELMPQANRVGTELDVTALDRLFGSTAMGHVKLDYGLRFQPSDHTIRMTQVRVRELALSSGSNNLRGPAAHRRPGGRERAREPGAVPHAAGAGRRDGPARPGRVAHHGDAARAAHDGVAAPRLNAARPRPQAADTSPAYHRALLSSTGRERPTERRAWIRCC